MMKSIQLNLISIAVLLALVTDARGGQETWGGDTAAIKFVKFGRLFEFELSHNSKCKLRDLVSLERWTETVDTTKIESVEQDQSDRTGSVFLNVLKWQNLKQDWKAEIVLMAYLNQLSIKPSEAQLAELIGSCKKSDLWKRNSNPVVRSKQKTELQSEIQKISTDLANAIQLEKVRSLPSSFSLAEFRRIAAALRSRPTQNDKPESNKTVIVFNLIPVSIVTTEGIRRDAQNTVRTESKHLEINLASWATLSLGQKKELLMHELLGLMRLDDSRYQHSSRLFLNLDASDYEKP